MPPNPSKIMAPVQMQSPNQGKYCREKVVGLGVPGRNGREKGHRAKDKAKPKERHERGQVQSQRVGGTSPKVNGNRQTPPSMMSKPSSASPGAMKVGQGQFSGRTSTSPDGSYAGAKFSEAPNADCVPMPPMHWLDSFSGKPKPNQMETKSCSQAYHVITSGPSVSEFDKITRDLKIMLNVES